ncbi:hypothetical protein KX505_26555, partial [Escherichia coli]|nr:hypothetical protein [Escherichia coli]
TIVSVVTLVWGISPRQPSGKNIIRWLLKKRTNGSVRYCQYTSDNLNHVVVNLKSGKPCQVYFLSRSLLILTTTERHRLRSRS